MGKGFVFWKSRHMSMRESPPPTDPPAPRRAVALARSVAPGVVIGLVLLAGLFGWIAQRERQEARQESEARSAAASARTVAAPERGVASVARQTAAKRLVGWESGPLSPFDPTAVAIDGFAPAMVTAPPYDAVDAVLFDTLDTRIRLAGVWPVARDEVCLDEARRRFACGLQARASLQNFMRGKTVVCRPMFGTGQRRDGIVEAHCTADGESLALYQVAAGFAFPARSEDGALATALAEARARKAGVWLGDYQIPAVDRSEADARAVRFGATRLSQSPYEMPQAPVKPGAAKADPGTRPAPVAPQPWANSQ